MNNKYQKICILTIATTFVMLFIVVWAVRVNKILSLQKNDPYNILTKEVWQLNVDQCHSKISNEFLNIKLPESVDPITGKYWVYNEDFDLLNLYIFNDDVEIAISEPITATLDQDTIFAKLDKPLLMTAMMLPSDFNNYYLSLCNKLNNYGSLSELAYFKTENKKAVLGMLNTEPNVTLLYGWHSDGNIRFTQGTSFFSGTLVNKQNGIVQNIAFVFRTGTFKDNIPFVEELLSCIKIMPISKSDWQIRIKKEFKPLCSNNGNES